MVWGAGCAGPTHLVILSGVHGRVAPAEGGLCLLEEGAPVLGVVGWGVDIGTSAGPGTPMRSPGPQTWLPLCTHAQSPSSPGIRFPGSSRLGRAPCRVPPTSHLSPRAQHPSRIQPRLSSGSPGWLATIKQPQQEVEGAMLPRGESRLIALPTHASDWSPVYPWSPWAGPPGGLGRVPRCQASPLSMFREQGSSSQSSLSRQLDCAFQLLAKPAPVASTSPLAVLKSSPSRPLKFPQSPEGPGQVGKGLGLAGQGPLWAFVGTSSVEPLTLHLPLGGLVQRHEELHDRGQLHLQPEADGHAHDDVVGRWAEDGEARCRQGYGEGHSEGQGDGRGEGRGPGTCQAQVSSQKGRSLHTQRPSLQMLLSRGHRVRAPPPPPLPCQPWPGTHHCSQSLVIPWPGVYRCPCSLQWHWLTGTQPPPAMSSYTVPGTAREAASPRLAQKEPESPLGGCPQASHPQASLILWADACGPHPVPGSGSGHGAPASRPGRRRSGSKVITRRQPPSRPPQALGKSLTPRPLLPGPTRVLGGGRSTSVPPLPPPPSRAVPSAQARTQGQGCRRLAWWAVPGQGLLHTHLPGRNSRPCGAPRTGCSLAGASRCPCRASRSPGTPCSRGRSWLQPQRPEIRVRLGHSSRSTPRRGEKASQPKVSVPPLPVPCADTAPTPGSGGTAREPAGHQRLPQSEAVLQFPGRPPAWEHWRENSATVLQTQASPPEQRQRSCWQASRYGSSGTRSWQSVKASAASSRSHSARWEWTWVSTLLRGQLRRDPHPGRGDSRARHRMLRPAPPRGPRTPRQAG
ncbi:hypothetical protein P7K49_040221 [Saguinus oedipus]|uniref:Uncharacterized protein n=1 Tax=Saguinus oedipus TaxID=9490 RepID=A0ABQ9T8N7_SAGOE|nr:hypothetical protein P7K49_040221 [Saguinus oedipus]